MLEELSRQRFTNDDIRSIQEAVWMRQLSQWVSRQPLDPLLAKWLESKKSQLNPESAEQFATAYRLFDWIVCNIQLDSLLASPDESTAAPAAGRGTCRRLQPLRNPRHYAVFPDLVISLSRCRIYCTATAMSGSECDSLP